MDQPMKTRLLITTAALALVITAANPGAETYSTKELADDYVRRESPAVEVTTTGNRRPYLTQVDICEGRVMTFVGNGELIAKGVRMIGLIGLDDCDFFFMERNSDVGRWLRKKCPIGSRCRIEAAIHGDGVAFVVNIERATAALALALVTGAQAQNIVITKDRMGREVMRTTRNQDGSTVDELRAGAHGFDQDGRRGSWGVAQCAGVMRRRCEIDHRHRSTEGRCGVRRPLAR